MRRLAALLPLCLLAATGDRVAPDRLVATMGLRPGAWHSTLTYKSVEVAPVNPAAPLPEEVRRRAAAKTGRTVQTDDCLGTGADADGNMVLPGITIAKECAFETLRAAGGKLVIDAKCGDGKAFASRVTAGSAYTADTMQSEMAVTATSYVQGIALRTIVAIDSRRMGECAAR